MPVRVDDLLKAARSQRLDHELDGLEAEVWTRIEGERTRGAAATRTLQIQAVAAGAALCIGLALGWSQANARRAEVRPAGFASYEQVGPLGRLEAGL